MTRTSIRWALLAFLVLMSVAAGVVVWTASRTRPEFLASAARSEFTQGAAALEADDVARARRHFEYADKYLHRLLQQRPESQSWLLRWRVLAHLTELVRANDSAADSAARSADLARRAAACLAQAAEDPACVEAHALLLDQCFRADELDRALPFARHLHSRQADLPSELPGRALYLRGAYFILVRHALEEVPPRADEALQHLSLLRRIEPTNQPEALVRWRVLGLEARALAILASEKNRAIGSSGTDLARLLPGWQDRLRNQPDDALKITLTDARGLLEVALVVAEVGEDWEATQERLDLLLGVCERLLSPPNVRPAVTVAVVTALSRAPMLMAARCEPNQHEPQIADLAARITRALERGQTAGVSVDLPPLLTLARLCRRENRLGEAMTAARAGLAAAQAQKKPSSEPIILEFHNELAAELLLQHKPRQAEEHLAALRAEKTHESRARFLAGLAAMQDGRLELAANELRRAEQSGQYANNLLVVFNLAQVYLTLGNHDEALPRLLRVSAAVPTLRQRAEAGADAVAQLLPEQPTIELMLLRCRLAAGQLEEALACRERLRGTAHARAASLALVRHWLGLATRAQEEDREQWLRAASEELRESRARYPTDAGFVLAEAQLIAARPEVNRPLLAGAAAALLFPSSHPALLALHADRCRRAVNWHLERADNVVQAHAAGRSTADVEGKLAWAQWLIWRGRSAEAVVVIDEVTRRPNASRTLQLLRGRLLLAQRRGNELSRLLGELRGSGADHSSDLLDVLYLLEFEASPSQARARIQEALARNETGGRLHLWEGELAQAEGDFRGAVQAYERALDYPELKAAARTGLHASLLALAEKESPEEIHDWAQRMHAAHPGDLALVLVLGELGLRLEPAVGPARARAALAALPLAVQREKLDPAWGPYFAAQLWQRVGRGDLARQELTHSLGDASAQHVPSLRLAGQLALDDSDLRGCWNIAERLAAASPESPEPVWWRGLILERQGRVREARQEFEEMAKRHPQRVEGYLGVAKTYEKEGDLRTALDWVRRCRVRLPEVPSALRDEVRILCLLGRQREADAVVTQVVPEIVGPSPDTEQRLPPRQAQERRNAADRAESFALNAAQGFADAQFLQRADLCLQAALRRARCRPTQERAAAVARVQSWCGEIYLLAGLQETDPKQRGDLIRKAVAAYREAHDQAPQDPGAANNLAYLLCVELRDVAEACKVVDRMRSPRTGIPQVSGDRLSPDFLDTIGLVYHAAGRHEETVRLFEQALLRYADEPLIELHLGRAYAARQMHSQALPHLTRAARQALDRAESREGPDQVRWQRLATDWNREALGVKQLLSE